MPRKKAETQTVEGQATVVEPAVSKGEVAVQSSPVLSMIERASRDPSVDIDKMERLIAMQERMHEKQAQLDYDSSMSAAQEEMEPVRVNAVNPETRSKYADYAQIDREIRPIYSKHGFSLSFNSGLNPPPECVVVTCRVAHRGGHREMFEITMPADGKGPKGVTFMSKTHATASGIQYGKRYLVAMIFNLAVTKDDDGNAASTYRRNDDDVENLKDNRKKGTLDKEMTAPLGGAKNWADYAVQTLNHATVVTEIQHWARSNASVIRWIEANDKTQHARIKTAYENALQAAQKRTTHDVGSTVTYDKAAQKSAGEAKVRQNHPSTDQPEDAAVDKTADTSSSSEGGDSKRGAGQAPVSEVVAPHAEPVDLDDEIRDEPIDVFQKFGTYGELITVSTEWLGKPGRTREEAQRWHAFHAVRLEHGVSPKYGNAKVKESILELLALYGKVVAQEG